jgi:hypothetical protein
VLEIPKIESESDNKTNQSSHIGVVMSGIIQDKQIEFKKYQISECSWETVKELFLLHHYLKSMPAGILAVYGLFDENNLQCLGAAVYSNGRIQYENKYIEFARLWITDEIGRNIESYFVSKTLKLLQKKYSHYEGVVTWADCNIGHEGTIYKALNFTFDGKSRAVKKYKGTSKQIIYQRTATKDSELIGEDKPKNRYVYYFDSKKREQKRNGKYPT